MSTAARPLSSRPLDLLYVIYFITHIPPTLLIDCQAVYPAGLVPDYIRAIPEWYVQFSNDPLIAGAMGYTGASPADYAWFKSFLLLEIFFQLPMFVLGARALWKDSRSIYVPLIIYGASTATTTLACVAVALATPASVLSSTQRAQMLASYIPFFVIPFLIAVDMSLRVHKLAQRGLRAETAAKSR